MPKERVDWAAVAQPLDGVAEDLEALAARTRRSWHPLRDHHRFVTIQALTYAERLEAIELELKKAAVRIRDVHRIATERAERDRERYDD